MRIRIFAMGRRRPDPLRLEGPGLSDWIRRDIGLGGAEIHNGKDKVKWRGWNM